MWETKYIHNKQTVNKKNKNTNNKNTKGLSEDVNLRTYNEMVKGKRTMVYNALHLTNEQNS